MTKQLEPETDIVKAMTEFIRPTFTQDLCSTLRFLRLTHDVSLQDMAEKTGYTTSHLCRVERCKPEYGVPGTRKHVSMQIVKAYADALETLPISIMELAANLPDCKGDSDIQTRRAKLEYMLSCLKKV